MPFFVERDYLGNPLLEENACKNHCIPTQRLTTLPLLLPISCWTCAAPSKLDLSSESCVKNCRNVLLTQVGDERQSMTCA